jgi:hypothetical protein
VSAFSGLGTSWTAGYSKAPAAAGGASVPAVLIMMRPFVILAVLLRVLPPWGEEAQLAKNKA